MDAVLEMDFFEVVGCPPDRPRGLSGPGFETGGVVVGDPENHGVRVVVFRFRASV